MKAVTVPSGNLKKAKQLIVTPSYLISLTGSRVLILTRKMELVKQIEGFRNAYYGFLSPDETRLLIVSTEQMVWMLSLERLEILWKSRLKEQRLIFAEGVAAWSLDGTRFYLIVQDIEKMQHRIRCYNADDPTEYSNKTLWKTPRLIHSMIMISSEKAYAFLSQDVREYCQDSPERALILTLWKDGRLTERKLSIKDIPMKMEYLVNMKKLIVYTDAGAFSCHLDGSREQKILFGEDSAEEQSLFMPSFGNEIRQIAKSANGRYVYVASEIGFEIFDCETGALLLSKENEWGVDCFTEIAPDMVAICKYGGGVAVYRLQN